MKELEANLDELEANLEKLDILDGNGGQFGRIGHFGAVWRKPGMKLAG